MAGEKEKPGVLEGLDFYPTCSLVNPATDTACGQRAFFSCRLPHAEVHGGDPTAYHLICYRCRSQHLTIKFPCNCPLCGGRVDSQTDWITDIKEL